MAKTQKELAQPTKKSAEDRMRKLPDVVSVEAALRKPSRSINVPNGEVVTVGPFNEHAKGFRLVEITNFEDLHRLGFVPDQVSEDHAVKALRADERAHREGVRRRTGISDPCSCGSQDGNQTPRILRRHFQDNLIELLQPLYRQSLTADDPAVIHPFQRLQSWLNRPSRLLLGLYALEDINIGKNATLTMTPTVRALYANNINIDDFGRLHFQSGNVHVRCATLNGPTRLLQIKKYIPGLSRELMEVQQ